MKETENIGARFLAHFEKPLGMLRSNQLPPALQNFQFGSLHITLNEIQLRDRPLFPERVQRKNLHRLAPPRIAWMSKMRQIGSREGFHIRNDQLAKAGLRPQSRAKTTDILKVPFADDRLQNLKVLRQGFERIDAAVAPYQGRELPSVVSNVGPNVGHRVSGPDQGREQRGLGLLMLTGPENIPDHIPAAKFFLHPGAARPQHQALQDFFSRRHRFSRDYFGSAILLREMISSSYQV